MSTIYLSEKKEYRALDFSKFVAAFLVAAIHIPPFEEAAPVFSHEFQPVSYTHLTLPTICSV